MPTVRFHLAFANLPERPLANLADEACKLREIVEGAHSRGLCQKPEVYEHCSVEDLFGLSRRCRVP